IQTEHAFVLKSFLPFIWLYLFSKSGKDVPNHLKTRLSSGTSFCRRSEEAEAKAEVAEERKKTILLMNTYPRQLSSIDEFKPTSIDKASTLQHLLNLILADFYTHPPCTPCSANAVNSKEQQLGLCAIQKIDPRWTKGASNRQHSDDNRSYLEQPDYVVHS
ncbi:hypothetical protein Tco_0727630, partial [Tanacetum coccineum]